MENVMAVEEKELNNRFEVDGKPLSMLMEALMKDISHKEYVERLKTNFSFSFFDNKLFLEEIEKLKGKVITKKTLVAVGDKILTKRVGFDITIDTIKEEMQIIEIFSSVIEEMTLMNTDKIISVIENFCKVSGIPKPDLQIEHDETNKSIYNLNVINASNGEVTTIIDSGFIVI